MKDKNYYIVEESVIPEIIRKVLHVKSLLEKETNLTVSKAVHQIGISRSAFYKYKNSVFHLYDHSRGKNVTFALHVEDRKGYLSHILSIIADHEANVLTINQNIPIHGIANITITIETNDRKDNFLSLCDAMKASKGVRSFKIIARE